MLDFPFHAEHNISCVFNVLDRPCIAEPKRFQNRTVSSGKNIKNLVVPFRVNAVRKFLSSRYIGNFKECIALHTVSNPLFIKLMGKQVMPVHVKLKLESRPCRNAEISEAEFFVDKIEIVIVMKALALVKLQESFSGFGDDLLDSVIFTECMGFLDELNFNPILLCNLFCILADLLRKGL